MLQSKGKQSIRIKFIQIIILEKYFNEKKILIKISNFYYDVIMYWHIIKYL